VLGELPPEDELDREFNFVGLAHRATLPVVLGSAGLFIFRIM